MEKETSKITVDEDSAKLDGFESFTEAFEAGRKAGIIEGYLKASDNMITTINRLQELFLKKIEGGKE